MSRNIMVLAVVNDRCTTKFEVVDANLLRLHLAELAKHLGRIEDRTVDRSKSIQRANYCLSSARRMLEEEL